MAFVLFTWQNSLTEGIGAMVRCGFGRNEKGKRGTGEGEFETSGEEIFAASETVSE